MTLRTLLVGEHIKLTRLTLDDISTLLEWYENTLFNRLLDSRPAVGQSAQELRQWLEKGQDSGSNFYFGIRLRETGELIGQAELDGILWSSGVCGLGIGIGSEAHRGKGYGSEAIRLCVEFAFNELNLHRITATVFSYNEASIVAFEKAGFTREGAFREYLHRDGQRFDMIIYGLLRHEWEGGTSA